MPNFQFIVSNPANKKAYKVDVDQTKATGIIGKIIGEKFNGDIVNLPGYELQVTGGTDKDGFPMHHKVHGPGRKSLVLSQPPCFHPKLKGQRKRKMIRGNTISADIVQINCKIVKAGAKPIEQLLGKEEKKEEAKPAEKPVENKEEKKTEEKAEKKEEAKPKKEGEEVHKESKS